MKAIVHAASLNICNNYNKKAFYDAIEEGKDYEEDFLSDKVAKNIQLLLFVIVTFFFLIFFSPLYI